MSELNRNQGIIFVPNASRFPSALHQNDPEFESQETRIQFSYRVLSILDAADSSANSSSSEHAEGVQIIDASAQNAFVHSLRMANDCYSSDGGIDDMQLPDSFKAGNTSQEKLDHAQSAWDILLPIEVGCDYVLKINQPITPVMIRELHQIGFCIIKWYSDREILLHRLAEQYDALKFICFQKELARQYGYRRHNLNGVGQENLERIKEQMLRQQDQQPAQSAQVVSLADARMRKRTE